VTPHNSTEKPIGLGLIQELTDMGSTQKINGWADGIRLQGYYYGNNWISLLDLHRPNPAKIH
jgi:hypothetical protein